MAREMFQMAPRVSEKKDKSKHADTKDVTVEV